jgi:hypothetical protein
VHVHHELRSGENHDCESRESLDVLQCCVMLWQMTCGRVIVAVFALWFQVTADRPQHMYRVVMPRHLPCQLKELESDTLLPAASPVYEPAEQRAV